MRLRALIVRCRCRPRQPYEYISIIPVNRCSSRSNSCGAEEQDDNNSLRRSLAVAQGRKVATVAWGRMRPKWPVPSGHSAQCSAVLSARWRRCSSCLARSPVGGVQFCDVVIDGLYDWRVTVGRNEWRNLEVTRVALKTPVVVGIWFQAANCPRLNSCR